MSHIGYNEVYVDGKPLAVVVENLNGKYLVYNPNVLDKNSKHPNTALLGTGKSVTAAKFHFVTQYREQKA